MVTKIEFILKVRKVPSIVEKDRKGKTRVEIAPSEEPRAPTVSLDEIEEDSYSDDDEEDDFAADAVDNRYREFHLQANLGWVDFDLGCSTILLGQ